MTPTKKKEYDQLRQAIGPQLKACLILSADATWHICRSEISAHAPLAMNQTEVWHGWEEMLRRTTRKSLATLHERLFGFTCPTEAKMSTMSLCILIWNYRCAHAYDHVAEDEKGKVGNNAGTNPLQRHSNIANRTYQIIKPSKDAKPYTSPAAMACLKIIKDTCDANGGTCTEAQLKEQIIARATEITKKDDSAWRFLQFYRPKLVDAEQIIYNKVAKE